MIGLGWNTLSALSGGHNMTRKGCPRLVGALGLWHLEGGSGGVRMSYIKHVIQPGENIVVIGRLSWIVYHRAIAFAVVGIILAILERIYINQDWLLIASGGLFGALALITAIHAWFLRWTTEIAVTDKRIIYKRGFITRHTAEMNMDKVASVDVDQPLLGRMLDYGSIRIVGTGGAPGIERLDRIGSPLALRNAIDVK